MAQNYREDVRAFPGPKLWTAVTKALGVRRLAKQGRVQPDGFRTPAVTLLLGSDGVVERRENGIRFAAPIIFQSLGSLWNNWIIYCVILCHHVLLIQSHSYTWDVRTCMFSAGNAHEKQRAAMWDCTGEIVCDMYAGMRGAKM